ncbi:hypothetical protein ACFLRI_03525, partial [Bacteroidota bacterium]
IICFPFFAISQVDNSTDTILVFTHKSKKKQKFVKNGKKITYWLVGYGNKNKGRLQHITDSTVVINGNEYLFSDFSKIGVKSTGLRIIQTSGKVVLITGTLVTSLGAYFIYYSYNYSNPNTDECNEACQAGCLLFGGIALTAAGGVCIIVGAIPLLIAGKKFDLEEKWDMHMEVVPAKKVEKNQSIGS